MHLVKLSYKQKVNNKHGELSGRYLCPSTMCFVFASGFNIIVWKTLSLTLPSPYLHGFTIPLFFIFHRTSSGCWQHCLQFLTTIAQLPTKGAFAHKFTMEKKFDLQMNRIAPVLVVLWSSFSRMVHYWPHCCWHTCFLQLYIILYNNYIMSQCYIWHRICTSEQQWCVKSVWSDKMQLARCFHPRALNPTPNITSWRYSK